MTKDVFPHWARWIAMDEDGLWWCYEVEPHQHDHGWYENEVGLSQKLTVQKLSELSWQQSLQQINN